MVNVRPSSYGCTWKVAEVRKATVVLGRPSCLATSRVHQ